MIAVIDSTKAKAPKVDLMFHNIHLCRSHMADPQEEAQAFGAFSSAFLSNYQGQPCKE
uniref:Uncharacterized protein n=1 Tax=Arundo donax TaxID=35708 RepID=A0A0A9BH55_ARUDO